MGREDSFIWLEQSVWLEHWNKVCALIGVGAGKKVKKEIQRASGERT